MIYFCRQCASSYVIHCCDPTSYPCPHCGYDEEAARLTRSREDQTRRDDAKP